MMKVLVVDDREETDSECIPRRLAAGLASEYKKTIPYVKIPCGLCRRVLHFLPELKEILQGPDMDVDFAKNFEEAVSLLSAKSYDIVIRRDTLTP